MSRLRWNNYKDNSRTFERGEDCRQRHPNENFQLPCHKTYVTLIDKTDSRIPTKREDCWVQTLITKTPMGLNVESGY